MKTEEDIQKSILEYLKKQEWPSTTEDIAAGCKLSWNTAQLHLVKLEAATYKRPAGFQKENAYLSVNRKISLHTNPQGREDSIKPRHNYIVTS